MIFTLAHANWAVTPAPWPTTLDKHTLSSPPVPTLNSFFQEDITANWHQDGCLIHSEDLSHSLLSVLLSCTGTVKVLFACSTHTPKVWQVPILEVLLLDSQTALNLRRVKKSALYNSLLTLWMQILLGKNLHNPYRKLCTSTCSLGPC